MTPLTYICAAIVLLLGIVVAVVIIDMISDLWR